MKAVVMWTFSAVIGLDQKFMTKAASGGKAEVELGRLASERGSSAR
jgi:hypothetical protein